MKFAVNLDLCESYAMCAFVSPEQFELDEQSRLRFREVADSEYVSPQLSAEQERGAQQAADVCPMQAIRMIP